MLSSVEWWDKYPFLRFVIPLIAGIICGDIGLGNYIGIFAAGLAASILFLFLSAFRCSTQAYSLRWVYGIVLYGTLFAAGVCSIGYHKQQVKVAWSNERMAYRAVVSGLTEERARSWMVPVEVNGKQVLLYLPKDSLSQAWRCGDEILFYARIYPPLNRGKAEDFDYARYLECKGISGTAYAGNGYWKRGSHVYSPTWKQYALMAREQLVSIYREWGLEGDELAVISALTLGDKSFIDEELKTAYSISGASHILALSGLHLGIVYAFISLLIGFRPRYGHSNVVRGSCLILFLWAFAYLTGLSGSVVRATVMFTVMVVGRCLHRSGNTLNSLSLAAFLMLAYNPYYLFDVGFQMSFSAVAGIVFFLPLFYRWVPRSRYAVVRYVVDVVLVSVAAQLGVAPLVAYYFDNFSVYFLVTNLVVVPLSFVLLCGSIVLWAVSWLSVLHGWLLIIIEKLLLLLNTVVLSIGQWPFSSLRVEVSIEFVVALYACFGCLLVFFYLRTARCLQVMLVSVCLGLGIHFYRTHSDRASQLYFYSDRYRGDVIECSYADGRSFLIEKAMDKGGLVTFKGKHIGVFQDMYWMNKQVPTPLPLEVAYVRKEFRGDFEKLFSLFKIQRVVLESSVSSFRRDKIEQLCRDRNIEVISLDDFGSYCLRFQD